MRRVFRGYEPRQVEAFLGRCLGTLGPRADFPELAGVIAAGPPVTRDDVRNVQFSVKLRGYQLDEVDRLLDRIAAALTD
jgi:DivIVA domain-containing protein